MKISLNWLKKYVTIPAEISDAELIRLIGARLVEVEGVIDETHKYDNIYVVRVEKAEKIPDTHLTLCQINVGDTSTGDGNGRGSQNVCRRQNFGEGELPAGPVENLVQVVCGAPNVREGMLAAWIKPGAIVPASVHEDAPFVIGKRKMLGKYDSNGMLAGADELDFGDDHSGIVEIDPEMANPGDLLADVFELNDLVLEIENKSLTHRPDTFGIIGFAREVAGILGLRFDEGVADNVFFKGNDRLARSEAYIPDGPEKAARRANFPGVPAYDAEGELVGPEKGMSDRTPSIKITDTNICKRYSAVVLEKHGEIKKKYLTWMGTILSKSGMRPIDPIVDVTNYLMLLTGQPLHAFDYDKFMKVGKVGEPRIVVRLARKGEKIVLLDDKEVELNENDIVICSNEIPVALAGAMGGKATEIDENTRKIIIESATFSLYNLRKTQMGHGIFSEAITRFTKGQPAYQTLEVAEECAVMLSDGFRIISIADEYPKREEKIVVKITTDEINTLLGTSYEKDLIVRILENVGFKLKDTSTSLEILVPAWRTDIHIKEDIIEEVGRLLGYDNIVPTLPLHATAEKNRMFELKKNIREIMMRFGANEVLTYSFVSERVLKKAGLKIDNSYKIVNSISPELQYVRQSIMPSLLEKAYINQKIPFDRFAIYEMNKVYQKKEWGLNEENVPVEKMQIGFILAERKNNGTAFYKAKKYVAKLLEEFNILTEFLPLKSKEASALPFEPKRAAEIWIGEEYLGVVGEFKNSVRNEFKLLPYLAGFEIDMEKILKLSSNKKVKIVKEKEKRDLTIETEKKYGEVVEEVKKILAENDVKAKIFPLSIYQPEDGKKRISMHLEFEQKIDDEIMQKLETL